MYLHFLVYASSNEDWNILLRCGDMVPVRRYSSRTKSNNAFLNASGMLIFTERNFLEAN